MSSNTVYVGGESIAPAVRNVTWTDRPWVRRQYQQFCGRFELYETSGLYFDAQTPEHDRQLISLNFLKLPTPLCKAALYLGLTVSTTKNPSTASGNHSAVYGDWERPHAQISPHLEMSAASLNSAVSLPHLVHECCHLFWAVQSKAAKLAYIQRLVVLVEERFGAANFVEVSKYAQDYFDEWRKLIDAPPEFGIASRRIRALEKWAMESFCESVAKACCPSYKEGEMRSTEYLLEARLLAMKAEFHFEPALRAASQ